MNVLVTPELVVAYSQCPRKAYLLCKGETGEPHEHVRILERRVIENREDYLRTIDSSSDLVSTNLTLRSGDFETYCDVLTTRGESSYEPTLVVGTYKVTQDQKIRLARALKVAYPGQPGSGIDCPCWGYGELQGGRLQ